MAAARFSLIPAFLPLLSWRSSPSQASLNEYEGVCQVCPSQREIQYVCVCCVKHFGASFTALKQLMLTKAAQADTEEKSFPISWTRFMMSWERSELKRRLRLQSHLFWGTFKRSKNSHLSQINDAVLTRDRKL